MALLASARRVEIDRFVAALFGSRRTLALSQPARRALDAIGRVRALLGSLRLFLEESPQATSRKSLEACLRTVEAAMRDVLAAVKLIARECIGGRASRPARRASAALH